MALLKDKKTSAYPLRKETRKIENPLLKDKKISTRPLRKDKGKENHNGPAS
jgi:hypothetical protein